MIKQLSFCTFSILIISILISCKNEINTQNGNNLTDKSIQGKGIAVPEGCVLVFTKTAGFRHESIDAGVEMMDSLCKELGVTMFHTEDASVFNAANVGKIKIIMFLNTTGDILDDDQKKFFTKMMDLDSYFMGIHSATDTEHNWPWYGYLIGAYFKDHPNDPNVKKAKLVKVRKDLPGATLLPDSFERTDEWYNFDYVHTDMRVLLKLDETSYTGGTNGSLHPIVWFDKHNKNLVYYNGMGHTIESYSDPLFVDQIRAALKEFLYFYDLAHKA